MHIYEYLFAAILVVGILVAASVIATTMPSAQLSASDKEQVKVAAEKIMTQILVYAGQPPNWGSDPGVTASALQGFGLAKYGETTREAYVLDCDNVLRLDPNNPLYVSPSTTASLLNLNLTTLQMSLVNNYGFTLEIHPVLRINVAALANEIYNVTVTSEYQAFPVVNAKVNATLYYYEGDVLTTQNASNQTDIGGDCTLSFNTVPDTRVLVVSIYHLGIHATQTCVFGQNAVQAYLIGNNLLLDSAYTAETGNVTEVIATRQSEGYVIKDFRVESSEGESAVNGFRSYTMNSVEPGVTAIITQSTNGQTIYASRNIDIIYSTIPQLASSLDSSSLLSYTLERTVIIGDTTCTVRLLLWRMSY